MNLTFTLAHQGSTTHRMSDLTYDYIQSQKPIVVHSNWYGHAMNREGDYVGVPIDPSRAAGELWTDRWGVVVSPWSKMHQHNRSRPCVHSLRIPGQCELFGADWVRDLSWQPTLYRLGAEPVIASRVEDVVTIAFDVVGPLDHCHRKPGRLLDANRWAYRMFPVIFDDKPGEVYEHIWLGVWPD
jgi:hypothetical protein